MSWAQKRRLMYLGAILIIIMIIGLFILLSNRVVPTCFDGKQNQDETGIDCGGSCTLICANDATAPNVLWTRTTKVQDGLYNVMAYISNSNLKASAKNVPYVFKLYDRENTLIYERKGITSLPAQKNIAIFESGIYTGSSLPEHIYFDFTGPIAWNKDEAVASSLTIKDKNIFNATTTPKIVATVVNNSLVTIKNIGAVVIVYDADDNARTFSRYIIDQITQKGEAQAIYTWPLPFDFTPTRIEIILSPESQ
jgi:hypothetical protein